MLVRAEERHPRLEPAGASGVVRLVRREERGAARAQRAVREQLEPPVPVADARRPVPGVRRAARPEALRDRDVELLARMQAATRSGSRPPTRGAGSASGPHASAGSGAISPGSWTPVTPSAWRVAA